MLDLSVSWFQLVAVAIVNFLISWLFYSRGTPWFKSWALGVGMDPGKRDMTEAERKAMPGLMLGALLSSFLLSYGLQVFVRGVGALAWLAFAVTHSLNSRFEGRKPQVLLVNNGLYLPTYAVFAGLPAIWK